MQEHESFGRPPNLRPRSAGVSHASPRALERLASEATRSNAAASLSERLHVPRPGSATTSNTRPRRSPQEPEAATLRPAVLLAKPPMRPRSAMLGSRGIVSAHRMELLQGQQQTAARDNQRADEIESVGPMARSVALSRPTTTPLAAQLQRAVDKLDKDDMVQPAMGVATSSQSKRPPLKRPFSAAASLSPASPRVAVPEPVLQTNRMGSDVIGKEQESNQHSVRESEPSLSRVKRPVSAAPAFRGSSPRSAALQAAPTSLRGRISVTNEGETVGRNTRAQSIHVASEAASVMASFQRDTFVYAVPRHCLERGRQYNPYDIVTVSHEALFGSNLSSRASHQARFDFYTVSPAGMTFHCKADNFEPSFLTSPEWERQRTSFFRICKLPTFQMFRYRKAFIGWMKWIRQTKIDIARTTMQTSLHFNQPILFGGMKAIRAELSKLEDLNLMLDMNGETLHLSQLSAKNRDYVQSQGIEILKVSGRIQQILLQVCQDCLNSTDNPFGGFPGHEFALSTRKSSNFHIFEAFVERERALATANHQLVQHHHFQSSGPMQTSKVSLSTAAQLRTTHRKYMERVIRSQQQRPQDALEEIRWTLAAIQRRRCLSLTKFVALVDFMVMDALHSIVVRSIQLLRDSLWMGANAVPISKLVERQDYVFAYHSTLRSCRNLTSGSSRQNGLQHRAPHTLLLNKQQLKRFLRSTWEAKIPRILERDNPKMGNTVEASDTQELKSSTAVWLESRLDSLFTHSLRENCGEHTELFSFDDAMFVVDENIAQSLVLPDFDASYCSILSSDKPHVDAAALEGTASDIRELQQIQCLQPVPLLHISVGLRVDERTKHCEVVLKPVLDQVPYLVQEILSSFVELFQGIHSVASHQEIRAVLDFAYDFRASSLVHDSENDSSPSGQLNAPENDQDEETRWNKSNYDRLFARISNDHYCVLLRVNIQKLIQSAIIGVEAFAKAYGDILDTYTSNEKIAFESFRARFRNGEYSLREMEADIRTYRSQIEVLSRLKIDQSIEFLQLNMTQLNEALSPSPVRCLRQLHTLLPSLAHERCEAFLAFVRAACKRIEKPLAVDNLGAFARYLLHLRDVQEEAQEKDFDLTFLHDMFGMLGRLEVEIPSGVSETFDLCEPEFEALRFQLSEAWARKEADIVERSSALAEGVKQLNLSIEDLKTHSADQAINAVESPSSGARSRTNDLEKESEVLIERSTELVWIQRVFCEFAQGSRPALDEFSELHVVSNELKLKNELWEAVNDSEEYLSAKKDETLRDIDLGQLRSILAKVDAVIKRVQQNTIHIAATKRLEQSKTVLEGLSPVIRDLRNESLEERHWTKLEHKLNCSFVRKVCPTSDESSESTVDCNKASNTENDAAVKEVKFLDLPLRHLLEVQAVNHAALIHQVAEEASAEAAIMKSFKSVSQTWDTREIPSFPKKDRDGRDAICLGECTEILTLLEESEVLLRVMESSSFARVIQSKLTKLLNDLAHTKDSMDLLVICQQKREHLQRLVSVDFVRSFPEQSKQLQAHDANWKSIMEGISKRPLCLPFGTNTEYRQLLQATLQGFEVASLYVDQHLEMKRELFPGFFKLSNTELAALLSKVRDINNVQQFLFQCFDNVGRINFGTREACQDVLSITSRAFPQTETILMGRNLKARGPPEQWLGGIEKRLIEMLRKSTKEAVLLVSQASTSTSAFDSTIVQNLPIQCILLADRILRSELVDSMLLDTDGTVSSSVFSLTHERNIYRRLSEHHATFVERMFGSTIHEVTAMTELSPREIVLLSSMRLHEIEFRDAVDEHLVSLTNAVAAGNNKSGLGINWQLQFKHRFDDSTTVGYDCHVEVGGVRVAYGFNYVNPSTEFVFTPRSMRFLFSVFGATRTGQAVLLTGQQGSGKQSLALQTSHLFGRRFFGLVASDTVLASQISHCVKLIRGALMAGGVLCVGFRMHNEAINLLQRLSAIVARIQHSVLCKLPITGLQSDPITWIPGTSLMFTCDLSSSSSLDRSRLQYKLDVSTTSFAVLAVTADHDICVVIEALMFSKRFEAPRETAQKLSALWTHLRSIDLCSEDQKGEDSPPHLFTLQSAKQIIVVVAQDMWKNDEPFEREGLQNLLICEAIINLCSPLFLIAQSSGDSARSCIMAALNDFFQYTLHESEWYSRQWRRNKIASTERERKIFGETLDEAAQELHYLPRRQLLIKSMELAAGLVTNVGAILVGPSGVGKTTTCAVLSHALCTLKVQQTAQGHDKSAAEARQSSLPGTVEVNPKRASVVDPNTVRSTPHTSEITPGPFVKMCVVLPMSLTLSQLFGGTSTDAKGHVKSLLGRLIREAQECFALSTDQEIHCLMSKSTRSSQLGSLLAVQKLVWVVFDGGSICGGVWLDILLTVLSRKFAFGLLDSCEQPGRQQVRFCDGEFMTIPPNLRFIFETWNLENATPAVLQHCAVVILAPEAGIDLDKDDDDNVPVHYACIQRFLEQQRVAATYASDGTALPTSLTKLSCVAYDTITNRLLGTEILVKIFSVIEDYGVVIQVSLIHRVEYMLALLQALLNTVASSCTTSRNAELGAKATTLPTDIPEEDVQQRVEMAIVYALLWGFCACCAHELDRARSRALQLLISGIIKTQFNTISHTWEDCGRDSNLFELLLDINGLRFVSLESGDASILREKLWRHAVSSATAETPNALPDSTFHALFIPTQSSLIIHAAMKEAIRSAKGVLLVGSDTSRKTTILQNFLKQLESVRILTTSNYASIPVPVSTTSDSADGGAVKRKRGVALIRAPLSTQTENSYATLDRIRLHQVGLVRRLAKKFRKVNKAAAAAAALAAAQRYGGSKHKPTGGDQPAENDKTTKGPKKLSEWALRPHIETVKSDMVAKFDHGDFIPFFFAMNQHDRGVEQLAKCLERMLQRERSGIFEPPPGKTAVLIIDDLHLPVNGHDEEHPSCHDYLRSAYEHATVLSSADEDAGARAITIENLMMIASISSRAMMPVAAGISADRMATRHSSLDKLTKQFVPIFAPPCSPLELYTIFQMLVVSHWERKSTSPLEKLSTVVRQFTPIIIAATTVLWERLRRRIPTMPSGIGPKQRSADLDLHDLARMYAGFCAVEPSYILDTETMTRLWAHEIVKTFGEIGYQGWMSVLKRDIFRVRILLNNFEDQQYTTASSATTTITHGVSTAFAANKATAIGSTTVSSQDGEAMKLTNLNTKTNPIGLIAFFSSELLDSMDNKTGAELAISPQQRVTYERKKLHQIPLWAFVPSTLYYQSQNSGVQTNSGEVGPSNTPPLIRRHSIKFMRRKSLENVVEGAAQASGVTLSTSSKSASLGNVRWIYAELPLLDDAEPSGDDAAIQMTHSVFAAIRVFGAASSGATPNKPVTDLILQTTVSQLPRGVPLVTSLLARNIAALERVVTPSGSRSVLFAPSGSGSEVLVRYTCAVRQTAQPQSIWTMEGVSNTAIMTKKWRHVVFQLFQRVGSAFESATLIVKRLPLWPQHLVGQLYSLMVSGEIPGAFSLEEQINLATRVRDERVIELEQRYQANAARIRQEVENEKENELLTRRADNESSTTSKANATFYQELERKYQHILLMRLAQVQLRHQQEMDDFLRKCEVENESVTATIMSLMRPLGMTSGKWQQVVQRMRKRLRIVVVIDTDEYQAVQTQAPRFLKTCSTTTLLPLDISSLKTLLYGSYRTEFQRVFHLTLSRSVADTDGVEDRAHLTAFIDRVEHELPKIVAVAAEIHMATQALAAEDNRKLSVEYAIVVARFFAKLLLSYYKKSRDERRKAEWFTYVYANMEKALWKLQDRDGELQSQLKSCDQQIEVSQELLSEQKEDCDRIRDMMKRYQESAEDQVQVTNEMELRAQAELHVPMACLEEANAALLMIDKRHIIEIKSFNSPPLLVHLVLDAICVMFQMEPAWENARKILSDANVVHTLLAFDKDNISNETIDKIETTYISDPRFHREEVVKQSVAASMMVVWVRAMYQYATARRQVLPTLEKLEQAQSRLRMLMHEYQVSKQRVVDADEALAKTKETLERAHELRRQTVDEMESRKTRLDGGRVVLECLVEDKRVADHASRQLEHETKQGLVWWNSLLSASALAYSSLFDASDRMRLFGLWSEAYLRTAMEHTTEDDNCTVKICFVPSIWIAVSENSILSQGELSAGSVNSAQTSSSPDPIMLFNQRHLYWEFASACGYLFSERSLQDAFLLTQTDSAGFPVVMITSYSMEMEELIVRCARYVWKWTQFYMISAKAPDLLATVATAVREGHQLLILDVDPLDIEYKLGALSGLFHWQCTTVVTETGSNEAVDHLILTSEDGLGAATTGSGGNNTAANHTTIPIHPGFRAVLSTYQEAASFGQSLLTGVPVVSAQLQASEIPHILLDRMWSPGLFEGGQHGFGLKQAVRDYERLRRQQLDAETHLTKLIQGAAVRGQFPQEESDIIRAACKKTKDIRQSIEQKYGEISDRINAVEKHTAIARLGSSIYCGLNAAQASQDATAQFQETISLHLFIPMFMSALKKPPFIVHSLTKMESSGRHGHALRGPSESSLLSHHQDSSRSSGLASPKPTGFDTIGEIFKKLLVQLMPLVRDVSEWYRFMLHMLWMLERQYHVDGLTSHPAALEAAMKSLEMMSSNSTPRVRRLLAMTKLSHWKSQAQCQDYDVLPSDLQDQARLVSLVVSGHTSVGTSVQDATKVVDSDEMADFSRVFAASRCRAERVKTAVSMYPDLIRPLCDSILQLYGVQVRFAIDVPDDQIATAPRSLSPSKASVRDVANEQIDERSLSSSDQNKLPFGWLRMTRVFPPLTCVVVRSDYRFGSFPFLLRVFQSTVSPDSSSPDLLKAALSRSFRSSEDLEEVFILPNHRLQSSDARGDNRSALSMMGENALMVRNFSDLLELEQHKLDIYLDDVPLAIINLQDVDDTTKLFASWEDLYQLINASPDRTDSLQLRRFESSTAWLQKGTSPQPGSAKAAAMVNSAIALSVSTRPTARRFSTQNLQHRRSDGGSLGNASTPTPSFITVVDGTCTTPHHLSAVKVALAAEATELGSNRIPSFKRCVQEALIRVAHHPCGDLFRQLGGGIDGVSGGKTALGQSDTASDPAQYSTVLDARLWQYLTLLVVNHALLTVRWQLAVRQYASDPTTDSGGGRYSMDILTTALDQLLNLFLQLRGSSKTAGLQSLQQRAEQLHLRVRQQVFVGTYTRQARTRQEIAMVRSLCRECLNLMPDSDRSHTEQVSAVLTDQQTLSGRIPHAPGITSSRSARSTRALHTANSSLSLQTSGVVPAGRSIQSAFARRASVRRSSGDLGSGQLLAGLNVPLEKDASTRQDVDAWIDTMWAYAESIDSSMETVVRDLFGLLVPVDTDLVPHPDTSLDTTPWPQLFGWIKYPIRYGSTASQISLSEALQCVELIHAKILPPLFETEKREQPQSQRNEEDGDSDEGEEELEASDDSGSDHERSRGDNVVETHDETTALRAGYPVAEPPGSPAVRQRNNANDSFNASTTTKLRMEPPPPTASTLEQQIFVSCRTIYDTHVQAVRAILQECIDGLLLWKSRNREPGGHREQTLATVADTDLQRNVLAVLCDQVPIELRNRIAASPTYLLASTSVSLDALIAHYHWTYRNLQQLQLQRAGWSLSHPDNPSRPWIEWWLPGIPAKISVAHLFGIARRRLQQPHTTDGKPDIREDDLVFSVRVESEKHASTDRHEHVRTEHKEPGDHEKREYPEGTVAVFSGLELRLAVWDTERGYLQPLDRHSARVPQRVSVICHAETRVAPAMQERSGSGTSATLQLSLEQFQAKRQRATRSCPLLTRDGVAYEFELPIGPAFGALVAPYLTFASP